VTVALGVLVIVIPLTCTFALLVILPVKSTSTERGLPLAIFVLQVGTRFKHPDPAGTQFEGNAGGVPVSQEAFFVSVSPSGVVPEPVAVFGSVDEIKFVLKVPL
jgi:hypothetical protein